MKNDENVNFVLSFKKFKCKKYIPKTDEIISFDSKDLDERYSKHALKHSDLTCPLGFNPMCEWRSFSLNHHPGLIIIKNVFTEPFEKFLTVRSLENYLNKPHKTNLDSLSMSAEKLWVDYKNDPIKNSKDIKKLRWATMGYHHNWDTKVYNLSEYSTMPKEIVDSCRYIASTLGYENYKAEASIVNFYHEGNTLAGHTDHSEQDQQSPIISISLGCSAIFMIGGESKEDKSSALLIKNGEVVVMSGHARMCYHAVPRVMINTFQMPNKLVSTERDNTNNACLEKQNKLAIHCGSDSNIYISNLLADSDCALKVSNDKLETLSPYNTKTSSNVNVRDFNPDSNSVETDNLDKTENLEELNTSRNNNESVSHQNLNSGNVISYFNHYQSDDACLRCGHDDDLPVKKLKSDLICSNQNSDTDCATLLKYDWDIYRNFLLKSRININVRQVNKY